MLAGVHCGDSNFAVMQHNKLIISVGCEAMKVAGAGNHIGLSMRYLSFQCKCLRDQWPLQVDQLSVMGAKLDHCFKICVIIMIMTLLRASSNVHLPLWTTGHATCCAVDQWMATDQKTSAAPTSLAMSPANILHLSSILTNAESVSHQCRSDFVNNVVIKLTCRTVDFITVWQVSALRDTNNWSIENTATLIPVKLSRSHNRHYF